jgi:hypothetical protein
VGIMTETGDQGNDLTVQIPIESMRDITDTDNAITGVMTMVMLTMKSAPIMIGLRSILIMMEMEMVCPGMEEPALVMVADMAILPIWNYLQTSVLCFMEKNMI